MTPFLRVHAILDGSRANGPGVCNVVWLQGCRRRCPGCFNPATHDVAGGEPVEVASLAVRLLSGTPEGVTLSGGEPLDQAEALAALLAGLRSAAPDLSLLLFSGFTLDEIHGLPFGPEVLSRVDVLVAGPYDRARHLGRGLLGSANQRIHLLTPRHGPRDLGAVPGMEAVVHPDGTVTLTGIAGCLIPDT